MRSRINSSCPKADVKEPLRLAYCATSIGKLGNTNVWK